MTSYLEYEFDDTIEAADLYDEIPLWSAPFGLLLLDNIKLFPGIRVLDIGSGTGFPLLEIASRTGKGSFTGLDIWTNGNARARRKIGQRGVHNTEIVDGSAEAMPFADESFDLIVSNLCLNNLSNRESAMKECHRVLTKGGMLALTTNTEGHWKEFYDVFEQTLIEKDLNELLPKVQIQRKNRGNADVINNLLMGCGLKNAKNAFGEFTMKFADGSAFLNHHFVKLGWVTSFREIIPEETRKDFFRQLEQNLNITAKENGCLNLTVPMLYAEAQKLI